MTSLRKLLTIAFHVIAIIVCGAAGALLGFALTRAIGLIGVPAAIVAALVAMVVATALWAGGSTLLRRIFGSRSDDAPQ
jgi:hypothetical protein